ncbi:MAG: DUF4423 domain-containing protein [Acidobacteria bacterium]|nr:DUF4423 domain-containing protein [Acidobacteriota bacterium]
MKTKFKDLIPQLASSSGFRLYLQSELTRRLSSNSQYSLRSFALHLGINHSTLSQLLRGKRALTPRMIETLGERLGLRPEEIEGFMTRERQVGPTMVSREIRFLTLDTVALLSDGSHQAILEMTSMEGFIPDSRWIARALDLTVDEVNLALSRLTRLGLLEMAAADRWIDASGADISSADGFARQVIRRLSERARQLSGAIAPKGSDSEDANEGTAMAAGVRIEINASQARDVVEFIERLRGESTDIQRDEKEYQIEINLMPINRNTRTKER